MQFRIATAFFLAMVLPFIGGCNLLPAPLEPAAVAYYNYMQGLAPTRKYTDFVSPAFRKAMPKESLTKLEEILGKSRAKNPRAIAIKQTDVQVITEANFGMSAAGPDASFSTRALGETLWVKDGGKWYLYLGSDNEVKRYGQFPTALKFPPPPPRAGKEDPDAPQ